MNNLESIFRTDLIEHGGDPVQAEAHFGVPTHGWLDLSTGINLVPYMPKNMPKDTLQRLPLAHELTKLLSAARDAYGVPDTAFIVASPGTQALILQIPTLFEANAISILSPTYGEHAPAWEASGHVVHDVQRLDITTSFSLVVNPNNPDGKVQSVERMLMMADTLHSRGGALIVDEAFADVTPENSITPYAGRPGLIVLRSFGKFYGLAGVRLGFAVCSPELGARLLQKMGPWAVSGPALWAGTQALNDHDWAIQSRKRLHHDALRLDQMLKAAGLEIVGGTDLFRLCKSPDAHVVYEKLGRAGILVRPFSYNDQWLRFGLPGAEDDWQRLQAALNL